MIAQIKGTVVDKHDTTVIVDVGGVGYELIVSAHDFEHIQMDEIVKLFTYFAVRENAQELYGFRSQEAKKLFQLLISVSGVGPKVGLSISSLGEPSQIKAAIASGNSTYISSASGVGKRGAEKVIVELKDKVGMSGDSSPLLDRQTSGGDDAHDALLTLGYSSAQAAQALARVDQGGSIEDRIKLALKVLSS